MTSDEQRYKTPEAARRAVTDKLKVEAAASSWRLGDLLRQYAYDQLVERLYRVDDAWVIKGATALLARRLSVRHTVDIDVYRAGAITDVERQVREAAAADIGDWMRFEVGAGLKITANGAQGARVKVQSFIGAKLWAAFQIDIVADGVVMTGAPEPVPPLTDAHIVDRKKAMWMAYPLVDHIADKVCAILERHNGRPSTRYKDLVDLVAITRRATVEADLQRRALVNEAARRDLPLPATFHVPDDALWKRGYSAEARRTIGFDAVDLETALIAVQPFLDPLLADTATGSWDPHAQGWE
ncbi:nucleotidyl transferase AbiEii/AbiGii toxin family protein [Phytoactinopolyspora limicola]|uniref:nucleotidyl transferase AbiEii/AbiGii toxin family protein n=1 Tax=Phytoactinopolyspora limicola TaxID=2715536 RepID=UPI00140C3F27|nr:nucleotidyl transferase AbiEii/AbiGii toxin family protein [Phytoactinopolyspora limicola]